MRKGWAASAALFTAALAVGGCMSNNTGDVGQKNIRPYYANDYEKNGNRLNGVHSFGSATYRTRFASDQANERNRFMGRDGLGHNIVGAHDNYRIEMNGQIAAQLAALPGVRSAYVLLTDHNAYVGVITDPAGSAGTTRVASGAGWDLGGALKDRVADHVKAMAPRIQNVYVTANPDFLARLQSYTQAAGDGHPVQGFLAEFNALAERVFPGAHGTSGTRGNGTDLSSDTGTDTGTERGSSLTGSYGPGGTPRSNGPLGTTGFR
jgi:YhcN/YlaJ family sporulation lipoprotein